MWSMLLSILFSSSKKQFLLLVFFLFCTIGFSQKRMVYKTILSVKDSTAINFANLSIKNTNRGTYSDLNGKFRIECLDSDSLIISSIGYKSQTCKCTSAIDTILLNENVTELKEITITSNKTNLKTKRVGSFKDKQTGAYIGANAVALYLENKPRIRGQISKVFILLSKVKWIYDKPKPKFYELLVRLKLCNAERYGNGLSLNILEKNIVERISEKQTKVIFDIEHLGVEFPDTGLFVGVEFLGYYISDNFIPFSSDDKNKAIQYKVSFSENYEKANSWIREDYEHNWERFEFSPNPFPNFNFGLELKY